MMKNLILTLFVVLMGSLCFAQGGLEGVIVEQVDANATGPGNITYRVFIDLESGYELQQVYGNTANPLSISTTTSFFNEFSVGNTFGNLINSLFLAPPFNASFPFLPFDSFVSLGGASSTEWGVLNSDAPGGRLALGPVNAVSTLGATVGASLTNSFGIGAGANLVIDDDGQFFTLTTNADVAPGNRIFVGQFTTGGDFSFALNVQTRVAGTANFANLTALEVPALNYPVITGPEGCSDPLACNHDPLVDPADDDGSCTYATSCDDGDACTTDSANQCDPLDCTNTDIDCDDNDACTTDSCDSATGCVNTAIDCDDNDACTTDSCDSATGCVNTAIDCDDNDACTTDSCDSTTGCANTAIDCDDNDACTTDSCDSTTGCVNTAIDCDDNDACTTDSCDSATGCVNTAIDCDDNDACTTDSCDSATGCVNTAVDCDDNDACTTDSCDSATGCVNTAIDCDDNDACTTDSCDSATGCVNTAVDCDDNDACTTDSCDSATGCVNTAVDCDDNDACTTDSCDSTTGCVNTAIDCDDNDACTTDSCDSTTGCVNTAIDCDDNDACTTDSCDSTTGCVNTAVDCDDNDACTTDSCDSTTGCVNTAIDCDDGDATTDDSCVNGTCINTPSGCVDDTSCDDEDACTTDTCDAGVCVYSPIDCNDGDICTNDSCDPVTGCLNTAIDCDDNDACTTDSCDPATGCVNTAVDCDDNDACTTDSCDSATGCVNTTIDCDDNDACTTDSCDSATGCVNTAIDCDDNDACTTDSCDSATGCVNTAIDCDDNDACTTDSCDSATGCVNTAIDCDDNDACTTDSCDPATGCVNTAVDCDDNDACTTDSCDSATGCVNTAIDCDDNDACTTDSCDPATGCVNTAINCDDNDACTTDSCDSVTGCVNTAIDCDDNDACTFDFCDPATGCVNLAIDCDDNDASTTDSCDPATGCVYGPIACDDLDECTLDSSDPFLGCVNTPIDCDDGDACTTDSCDPATGCVNTAVDCDDNDACTTDSCDSATGCVNTAIDCDDNDACTTDSCDSTTGCVNTAIDCDDGDACTADSCDPATGCVNTAIDCDDNDACTTDSCDSATGCVNTAVDCDDGDPSTTDSCDPATGCVNTPNPGSDCANALVAVDGVQTSAGTLAIGGTGATDACFTSGTPPPTAAVWYVYTATCDGVTTVSSAIDLDEPDTRVSVHSECDVLDCLAADDDDGPGFTSTTSFTTVAGEDYYLEWDDRWDGGEFDFEISCTPTFECPALGLNIGDACDDGDFETEDDVVDANCVCAGIDPCPNPDNDEAAGAFANSANNVWGVPGWDTYDVGCATLSMQTCDISNATSDTWYQFVAQAENQGVLARANPSDPNAANVNMAVEIFDATLTPLAGTTGGACTESRSCYNNYGAGEIERCVPGGLTIGATYFYRVYDAAGASAGSSLLVDTKVKTFADQAVVQGCFPVVSAPGHTWHIEDPDDLYNAPVPVFFVRMVLTEVPSGNVVAMTAPQNPITIGGLEFQLSDFGAIAPGDYNVHAQNEVKMQANGCISAYWSQIGPGCATTIGAPSLNSSLLDAASTDNITFAAYPNPNNGEQVYLELVDFDEVDADVVVAIFDMYGKQVHMEQFASSANDSQRVITFEQNLSAGMYFINLTVNDRVLTQKLVVQ
jgi:hypothetical protein